MRERLMDLEVVDTCPLGSTCQEILDGKIHRCRWFIKIKGVDAVGDEHDEWNCAISWQPLLMLENSTTSRGISSAVESMRNESMKSSNTAMHIMIQNQEKITQAMKLKSVEHNNIKVIGEQ